MNLPRIGQGYDVHRLTEGHALTLVHSQLQRASQQGGVKYLGRLDGPETISVRGAEDDVILYYL